MNAPYQNIANGLATLGRYEDTYLVHAAEGETVIPKEVFDDNPSLKDSLFKQMKAIGIENPERYIVGSELNSINPQTGQPEFFLKKLGKVFKKALPTIGSVVGFAIGGPAGAAIGGGLGGLASGQSPEQALITAGLSFAGSKFLGPAANKALGVGAPAAGGMVGPTTAGTLGSVLPQSIASSLPASVGSAGIGALGVAALAPNLSGAVSDMLAPVQEEARPIGPSVVDQYYADVAAGKNPPLPAELTPPPEESLLVQKSQVGQPALPGIEDILVAAPQQEYPAGSLTYSDLMAMQANNPVLTRPLFTAAYGGYIKGPGGPRDDKIPTLLSNTEFVQTGKAVAGADPSGKNNPDEGAKVMMGIMKAFERKADKNANAMA